MYVHWMCSCLWVNKHDVSEKQKEGGVEISLHNWRCFTRSTQKKPGKRRPVMEN